MDDKVAQNDKRNGNKWNPIVVGVISAVLGSLGSITVVFTTDIGQSITRPYPYTSVMAEARHKQTDTRLELLEDHVRNHPDSELRQMIADLRTSIAASDARQGVIIKNQDRILDKLDAR